MKRAVYIASAFLVLLASVLIWIFLDNHRVSPEQQAALDRYRLNPSEDCPDKTYQRCLSLDPYDPNSPREPPPPGTISADLLQKISRLEGLQYLVLTNSRIDSLAPLQDAKDLVELRLNICLLSQPRSMDALQHVQRLGIGSADCDISGVGHLHELKRLSLSAGFGADLKPLAGIGADVVLSYYADRRSGQIDQLGDIPGLKELHLFGVRDLTPLAQAERLSDLILEPNGLSDLSPLAKLSNLRSLSILSSAIRDIAPLAANKSLSRLYLVNTAVSDLTPLVGLTRLEVLYLGYSDIGDVTVLAKFPELRELNLEGHTPLDLSPLLSLKRLQKLYLNYRKCLVDPPQMLALQANGVFIYPTTDLRDDDPTLFVSSEMCSDYRAELIRLRAAGDLCPGYGNDCVAARR